MIKRQTWLRFKVKNLREDRTVRDIAKAVSCSTRAVRAAVVDGRCPRVKNRLQELGFLSK